MQRDCKKGQRLINNTSADRWLNTAAFFAHLLLIYRSRFGSIPDQDRINDGVALAAVKIIRNDVPLHFWGIAVIGC